MLDCPPPKYLPMRFGDPTKPSRKPADLPVRCAREALRVQAIDRRVPEFAAVHASRLFSIAENNGVVLQ